MEEERTGRGEAGSEGQTQGMRDRHRDVEDEKTGMKTGEVAQQSRTCTALAEDLSLVPGTLVW